MFTVTVRDSKLMGLMHLSAAAAAINHTQGMFPGSSPQRGGAAPFGTDGGGTAGLSEMGLANAAAMGPIGTKIDPHTGLSIQQVHTLNDVHLLYTGLVTQHPGGESVTVHG